MELQGERVTITDIDIPFGRLVMIFVKFVLAAIPAYIIVFVIIAIIIGVIGALFGGVGLMMSDMWRI